MGTIVLFVKNESSGCAMKTCIYTLLFVVFASSVFQPVGANDKELEASKGSWPNMLCEKSRNKAITEWNSRGVVLTVVEPAGIDRLAEPVVSGIPLCEGTVRDAKDLTLSTAGGQAIPAQFKVLSRWPDGSLKWVLTHFLSSVKSSNRVDVVLLPGQKKIVQGKPVGVVQKDGEITIANGFLSIVMGTNSPGLLHTIIAEGVTVVEKKAPIDIKLVDGSNVVYRAGRAEKCEVEADGPIKATVYARGRFETSDGRVIFGGKVAWDLRVTVFAGQPYADIAFCVLQDGYYGYRNERGAKREWLYVRQLALDFPLSEVGMLSAALTVGGETVRGLNPGHVVQKLKFPSVNDAGRSEYRSPQELSEQKSYWTFEETIEDAFANEMRKGAQPSKPIAPRKAYYHVYYGQKDPRIVPGILDGWIECRSKNKTISLSVRRFVENYPIGFGWDKGGISLLPLPLAGYWPRTAVAGSNETYQIEGGRHKTWEVRLCFGGDRKPSEIQKTLDFPLFARAPANWYRNTGAVLPLATGLPKTKDKELVEAFARYDRWQIAKVDRNASDPIALPDSDEKEKDDGLEDVPANPRPYDAKGACAWDFAEDAESDVVQRTSIPIHWRSSPEIFLGWMNYGDFYWGFGYCSLHYAWPYTMYQNYLRLGTREMFDLGEDMIRHRYDIDQYHVEKTENYLGLFQRYEKGFHGDLSRHDESTRNWEWNCSPSHTWNRDLLLAWALTGNPKALEVARQNGRAYQRLYYGDGQIAKKELLEQKEFRTPGWAIDNWLALYEYTGEKEWLDMANEIFSKTLLAMEKKNGAKGHIIAEGRQSSQFVAMITEPICRLHHLTGRKDAADFLERVLHWQKEKGAIRGKEKDGKYLKILWRNDWDAEISDNSTVAIDASDLFSMPLADGYAYLGRIKKSAADRAFARHLFTDAMFYTGLGSAVPRQQRMPLGFHFRNESLSGDVEEVGCWSGRYCQLFMMIEQEEEQ